MTTWLPRGLLFAIGMVLLRLVQGSLVNASPTHAGSISISLVALFGLAALIWGFFDGVSDARANPDPDRRRDLAMRWLLAGLFAGVVSGIVCFIIARFYKAIYADGIVPEVTAYAAFTALMMFLPAMITIVIGRWVIDRRRPYAPRHHGEGDVFESVYDHEPRTGPIAPVGAAAAAAASAVDYPDEYPAQVAVAEREAYQDETEEITAQIQEQADRIETEINEIVDDPKKRS